MPVLNGFDFIKKLKLDNHTKNIPVVIMTSSTNQKQISYAYTIGAYDYFIRPLDETIIVAKIKKYFEVLEHSRMVAYSTAIEKENQKIKYILDSQSGFTIIVNRVLLVQANKGMLDFFGYKSVDQFLLHNDSVSDFFIKGDGFLEQNLNGISWLDWSGNLN